MPCEITTTINATGNPVLDCGKGDCSKIYKKKATGGFEEAATKCMHITRVAFDPTTSSFLPYKDGEACVCTIAEAGDGCQREFILEGPAGRQKLKSAKCGKEKCGEFFDQPDKDHPATVKCWIVSDHNDGGTVKCACVIYTQALTDKEKQK